MKGFYETVQFHCLMVQFKRKIYYLVFCFAFSTIFYYNFNALENNISSKYIFCTIVFFFEFCALSLSKNFNI